MKNDFRIVTAGDATLIVEFADRIDPVINGMAVALAETLGTARIKGVRDIVPTYRSVAIHFDPLRADYQAIVDHVEADASSVKATIASSKLIQVPVCYGGGFGPDLANVAAFAAMSETDAIRLHTSRLYRVFMLGFMPGFAYMGTVDERIAAPRLSTPRVRVPPGSVGIAGAQTGIYSASTPGGWQIVGRTPFKPFDLNRAEPFLFEPGDTVQFYAIEAAEYARLQHAH